MNVPSTPRSVAVWTGFAYGIIGLALACAGAWLVALGGSFAYLLIGLGIVVTGGLLIARRSAALWVYAGVMLGTIIWAVAEIGFDWWPLAARGDVVFPLGLWLLTPWVTRELRSGTAIASGNWFPRVTWPRGAASGLGAIALVVGLASNYNEIHGAVPIAEAVVAAAEPEAQPEEDWRAYGRSQFGQRYSPLRQITPENVKSLKV